MTRVLIATADSLGPTMAGPAIRAAEISKVLAGDGHEIRLGSTKPITPFESPADLVELAATADGAAAAEWAEVIIVQGALLRMLPDLARADRILVADAYDPIHFERLNRNLDDGPLARRNALIDSVEILSEQLFRADFVLCASELQRHLWLGHLSALGRVNPRNHDQDADLRGLIDVVPFGLPDDPPRRKGSSGLRSELGIDEDDRVLIWAGGVYDWFDPLTLVDAVEIAARTEPSLRLVFMGLVHPNPSAERPEILDRLIAEVESRGLRDEHVFLNEGWVPYDQRQNWLLDADAGVSTHRRNLETTYSYRTRMLDYLWCGLPMISSANDTFGDLIDESGWGITVPPEEVDPLASAILELLGDDAAHDAAAQRIAADREQHRWSHVSEPLRRFVADPHPAPDRSDGVTISELAHLAPRPVTSGQRVLRAVKRVARTAREDGIISAGSALARRVRGEAAIVTEEG